MFENTEVYKKTDTMCSSRFHVHLEEKQTVINK